MVQVSVLPIVAMYSFPVKYLGMYLAMDQSEGSQRRRRERRLALEGKKLEGLRNRARGYRTVQGLLDPLEPLEPVTSVPQPLE